MTKWVKFYKDRMNEVYYQHVCSKYKVFIDKILKEINIDFVVAEFGCGMGNITRALIERNNNIFKGKYHLIDSDVEMLNMAVENLGKANATVRTYNCDVTDTFFIGHIVHSHGLLEHFDDKTIKSLILRQLSGYNKIFHYVPSAKYEIPSFGDERLLTVDQWKKICNPDEIIEFNEGYDLILCWK